MIRKVYRKKHHREIESEEIAVEIVWKLHDALHGIQNWPASHSQGD
jgi:hypothetical protein